MSGGAFDYIEFLPDRMIAELQRLEDFTKEAEPYCQTGKAAVNLYTLQNTIKDIRQALESINTDFLHRVEWVASGDTTAVYKEEVK